MATRRVPFRNLRSARRFAEKMADVWEPEIYELEEILTGDAAGMLSDGADKYILRTHYEWLDDDLVALFSNDHLYDLMSARTNYYQKPFDVRPVVSQILKPILKFEKAHYLEHGCFTNRRYKRDAMNVVRQSVGLALLPEVQPKKKARFFSFARS